MKSSKEMIVGVVVVVVLIIGYSYMQFEAASLERVTRVAQPYFPPQQTPAVSTVAKPVVPVPVSAVTPIVSRPTERGGPTDAEVAAAMKQYGWKAGD